MLLFRHFVEWVVVRVGADGGGNNLLVFRTIRDDVGEGVVEVDHRGERHGAEGFLHRGVEETKEEAFVLQFHFHFGGTDVHVDVGGVYFQSDEVGGVGALWDEVGVGLLDGEIEQVVAHITVVDEHVLFAFPFGVFGLGDEAGDAHQFVVEFHGEEFVVEMLAEDVDDALPHIGSRQHEDELAR